MYAIKLSNEIYHLLQRGGHNTLCGLRVSRATSARPYQANELDANERVCQHCRRINEQDFAEIKMGWPQRATPTNDPT